MKEKYSDAVVDKRRSIVNLILLVQAPIILIVLFRVFKLPWSVNRIISGSMLLFSYFIYLKWRILIDNVKKVDTRVLEDIKMRFPDYEKNVIFLPWSNYRSSMRKKDSYMILVVVVILLIAIRLFPPGYAADLFLVTTFISFGLLGFASLSSAEKYTANLLDLFSTRLYPKLTNADELSVGVASLATFSRAIPEAFIFVCLFLTLLTRLTGLSIVNYFKYTVAGFILYAMFRLLHLISRNFLSVLEFIDRVEEQKSRHVT